MMNYFRKLLRAIHEERIQAHKRWLTRKKVTLPKPEPDWRSWSDEYMRSLRNG